MAARVGRNTPIHKLSLTDWICEGGAAVASSRRAESMTAEWLATARLALPIIAAQLGMMAMGTVDIMMVGRYSQAALAATALGHVFSWGLVIFGFGVLASLDPVISQAIAANDKIAARRGVQRGLVLAVLLTPPLILLGIPAEPILEWLGQPPSITRAAADYVWFTLPGVFPFLIFVVFRQCLQAMGKLSAVLWTVLVVNVLNAGLDWLLIFGNWGVPELGVAGSAIATSISRLLLALGITWLAWPSLREYLRPWDPAAWRRSGLWRMFRLGAPVGVQFTLEMGVFAATALLMGWIGEAEVAGHQIAINLASLTFMVPVGIGAAVTVRVGYAIGYGSMPEARRAAGVALMAGSSVMAAFGLAMVFAPAVFARLYFSGSTAGVEGFAVACTLIPLAGLFQVFDGVQVVCVGILRGLGDTRTAMIVNAVGFWIIGLPIGFGLAFAGGHGPTGLWWGLVSGLAAVAIILAIRVAKKLRGHVERLEIGD